MTVAVPVRCRWCDRILKVLRGALVCPRCDKRDGDTQPGVA